MVPFGQPVPAPRGDETAAAAEPGPIRVCVDRTAESRLRGAAATTAHGSGKVNGWQRRQTAASIGPVSQATFWAADEGPAPIPGGDMKADGRFRGKLVAGLCAAAIAWPAAVWSSSTNQCHQLVVLRSAMVKKKRALQVAGCLRHGNFENCASVDALVRVEEAKLLGSIGGPGKICKAALDDGATPADFAPAACAADWNGCDLVVPAINTMADLAECLRCHEEGYDLALRNALGMPRSAPVDRAERLCAHLYARATGRAVRQASLDAAKCSYGLSEPFDCPVDDGPPTRFAEALAVLETSGARCGIDQGDGLGALADLCHGRATNQAELTACFVSLAKCLACRTRNAVLDQNQDCIAFSGDPACTGSF